MKAELSQVWAVKLKTNTSSTPNQTHSLAISMTLLAMRSLSASVSKMSWMSRSPEQQYLLWCLFWLSLTEIVVEVFRCSTTKEQHLELVVLGWVFKFQIFVPLFMLSPKITMLLLISDDALLSLSKWSRFVVILILLLSFIWLFISCLSHCSLTLIQHEFV